MGESDPRIVTADFYDQHYTVRVKSLLVPDMKRIEIGDKANQVCRFCRKGKPEVSFRSDAHAIPESLGNKTLFTNYECDSCNQKFGRGIENDFGIWSNTDRTISGISGKNGVPTVKVTGWRVKNENGHIKIKQDETAPDYVLDEEKKQVRFDIEQGTYTPVAVLKTFVRMGLTLLPVEELPNFSEALDWIQEEDHTKSRLEKHSVIRTFQPGVKLDGILATLLIRKAAVIGVPYAFLILAYGYNMFQVCLPSPQDRSIYGRNLRLPRFPMPGIDPASYGKARVKLLDLCGREKVKGKEFLLQFSFGQMETRD